SFFFQAEDGIRDFHVTGVQTCALPIWILRPGEHPGQGVGYLEDGTMVVVENGAEAVGREERLVVTGTLQTSAGRMVFARLASGRSEARRVGTACRARWWLMQEH